jgi:hypothetical protein
MAAAITALSFSPIVAVIAATLGGGSGIADAPAVWTPAGVALVVVYSLVGPAGGIAAWGLGANGGRAPLVAVAAAALAPAAALVLLWAVREGGWTPGAALFSFIALLLLPTALAAVAGALFVRAERASRSREGE